ncbi:MAG: hypothetical protein KIS68_00420 [Bauldia sp.]|nr:hypothetical protein [Bauldia sp.]
MLGSGLYFPHIDISDPAWLRSAILFWDEIQTIVPSAIDRPYRSEDSDICHKEGYLKPLVCDLHQDTIEELGNKIMRLATDPSDFDGAIRDLPQDNPALASLRASERYRFEVEDVFHEVGVHPSKISPETIQLAVRFGLARMHRGKMRPELRRMLRDLEMAHIHPEKLPYVLRDIFRARHRYEDEDGEWLLVDSRFADAYMAALAARLSKQLELSPLTYFEPSHGLSFRFMFDDVVDNSPQNATGALVSVVMRGLRVDSSVPVEKIIRFRRSRQDQYLEMSQKLRELSDALTTFEPEPGTDAGHALRAQASKLYQKEVDPKLRALKRELDNQSIQTMWEGAYRALTISVPSAGALAYFTGLTGPALLGAGAALAVADIGVRSYLAGRKSRASNPFSYLHDVSQSFGLPEFAEG